MIPVFQLTEEAVHQQYRQQQIDAQHAQQAQLRAQAGHLPGESDQNSDWSVLKMSEVLFL